MHVTIGFLACITTFQACWWQTVGIDIYRGLGESYAHITEDWCRSSAAFYIRDLSRITKGNVPNFVAESLQIGLPNVIFDPETIQCWPIKRGPA